MRSKIKALVSKPSFYSYTLEGSIEYNDIKDIKGIIKKTAPTLYKLIRSIILNRRVIFKDIATSNIPTTPILNEHYRNCEIAITAISIRSVARNKAS